MKATVSGHTYALDNLKDGGTSMFSFFRDGRLHGEPADTAGPSCQEVLRMIIDRVQFLDAEKAWFGNDQIICRAREMIALFEMRAMQMAVEKGFEIEKASVNQSGHICP